MSGLQSGLYVETGRSECYSGPFVSVSMLTKDVVGVFLARNFASTNEVIFYLDEVKAFVKEEGTDPATFDVLVSRGGGINRALKSKTPAKNRCVEATSTMQEVFDKLESPLTGPME